MAGIWDDHNNGQGITNLDDNNNQYAGFGGVVDLVDGKGGSDRYITNDFSTGYNLVKLNDGIISIEKNGVSIAKIINFEEVVFRDQVIKIDNQLEESSSSSNPSTASDGFYFDDGRNPEQDYLDFDQEGLDELRDFLDSDDPRTLSGFFNNSNNPEFGAANQPLIRLTEAEYGENGAPRGVVDGVQTLANEREISNVIADQDENNDGVTDFSNSAHGTNQFLTAFGQFFDHGLDFLARSGDPDEKYYIPLDESDELYKFSDDGNPFNDITSIRITRGEEAINPETGEAFTPRAHINKTSPFIDQNQTYGSSDAVGYYLRLSATDSDGNVIRNSDGTIEKLAGLKNGIKDDNGFYNLPTYRDILINNGMSDSVIQAAIDANDFSILVGDPNFVDFRNVIDPKTGEPDGNPLLLDIAHDADPAGRSFDLDKLLIHYVAGDGRVNENIALTPIHTIFHRDHDHWVEVLREKDPSLSEEELFESAKLIVGAEYQRVIFDEFIDAMAGSLPGDIPHGFNGYQPRVDAQISEEFAHAVYRVGHSMVTETVAVTDEDGSIRQVSLVEAFLNPKQFEDIGADAIISGNTRVTHERIDENLVDAVRNQLLGVASDLGAINIARGREVGVMSLNDVRRELYNSGSREQDNGSDVTRALKGNEELKPYENWDDFASNLRDPSLIDQFKAVYDSVDDVDLWIGGLAEKPRSSEEGQMGTTFTWVFWEQMDRLQDGDKFYYEGFFKDSEILGLLENQFFSDIITRNSDQEFLADKVFQLSNQIQMGRLEKDGSFGSATETIIGNDLDNVIKAGGGNDTVYGQAGNDEIYGESGDDGLRGEDGNDRIFGGDGDDRIVGGDGDDYLDGGDEEDAINGNDGNDTIYGGEGPDELHGNNGDDFIVGGSGNDTIKGGLGNDTIYGEGGKDRIETNGGNDVVFTGSGHDRILMSDNQGFVTVEDFNRNEDRIDMDIFDIRTYEELQQKLTIVDIAGGVMLQISSSQIYLKGTYAKDLTMDNFKFDNDDQNLIINGRIDEGRIEVKDSEIKYIQPVESGSWEILSNDKSTGWKNSEGEGVEYQKLRGNTVIEIDAHSSDVDEIYQTLPTREGVEYKISFDALERTAGSSTIQVLWNDQVIASGTPGKVWATNEFKVTGTGGVDKLSFRELASENDGYGAYIDNVIVAPASGDPLPYTLTGNDNATVYMDNHEVVEYVDGKGGEDSFRIRTTSENYSFSDGGNGYTAISVNGDKIAFIKNVEKIVFDDVTYEQNDDGEFVTGDGNSSQIFGTDGNDYIPGTDGDDIIDMKAGLDVAGGSSGNDIIKGGDSGYNQVDYDGQSSDYTFERNSDGSIKVTKPNGIDTLTDIGGIWFRGEAVWKAVDDLISDDNGGGGGDTNTITGTDGDDFLSGTSGNDIIELGLGQDVVNGSSGDDIINGGDSGYNQVDYDGSSSEYTFVRNDDGTITVTKPDGVDTLTDISGFWFKGEQVWKPVEDVVAGSNNNGEPVVLDGTDGDDYILTTSFDDVVNAGDGNDVIRSSSGDDIINGGGSEYDQVDYQGSRSDYVFTKNADGTISVAHDTNGTDILTDIDGVWFEGDNDWQDIDDLAV